MGPRPTGVGRSIIELVQALARADRSLTFTVLVTQADPFHFLAGKPDWRVLTCPGASGSTWRKAFYTQAELPRVCRRLKADGRTARILDSLPETCR